MLTSRPLNATPLSWAPCGTLLQMSDDMTTGSIQFTSRQITFNPTVYIPLSQESVKG